MIVCLCHRISDRDIRRDVAAGVRSFDLLQDETGVASACGCCHDCAREVFDRITGAAGRTLVEERFSAVTSIDSVKHDSPQGRNIFGTIAKSTCLIARS